MATGGDQPGSLNARYEELAGDENERRLLYAVRYFLHFSVDEWSALPHWQQRLYIEGLEKHKPWDEGGEGGEGGGSQAQELPDADADIGAFSDLGLNVQSM